MKNILYIVFLIFTFEVAAAQNDKKNTKSFLNDGKIITDSDGAGGKKSGAVNIKTEKPKPLLKKEVKARADGAGDTEAGTAKGNTEAGAICTRPECYGLPAFASIEQITDMCYKALPAHCKKVESKYTQCHPSEGVVSTTMGVGGGCGKGVWEGVAETAEGLWSLVKYPFRFIASSTVRKEAKEAASHVMHFFSNTSPGEMIDLVGGAGKKEWEKFSGCLNAEGKSKYSCKAMLFIADILIGGKGIQLASKKLQAAIKGGFDKKNISDYFLINKSKKAALVEKKVIDSDLNPEILDEMKKMYPGRYAKYHQALEVGEKIVKADTKGTPISITNLKPKELKSIYFLDKESIRKLDISHITNKQVAVLDDLRADAFDVELANPIHKLSAKQLSSVDFDKAGTLLDRIADTQTVNLVKTRIATDKFVPNVPANKVHRALSKFSPEEIPHLHNLGKAKPLIGHGGLENFTITSKQINRLTASQAKNVSDFLDESTAQLHANLNFLKNYHSDYARARNINVEDIPTIKPRVQDIKSSLEDIKKQKELVDNRLNMLDTSSKIE